MLWRVAVLLVMLGGAVGADDDDKGKGCVGNCRDGNPCTIDECTRSGCLHLPLTGGVCDDGDPCTEGEQCRTGLCLGGARRCDDGIACTRDSCVAGVGCRHQPTDALCGDGECTAGTCRPDDPATGADGCVATAIADGAVCDDDGFACTADHCAGGECVHVPHDERCVGTAECGAMTCDPDGADADQDGCAVTRALHFGEECGDDDDPCTDDVCRGLGCAHERVADVSGCAPVRDPYRTARHLAGMARALGSELASATDVRAVGSVPANSPLRDVESHLEAAARALAGKSTADVVAGARVYESTSQVRARAAATILRTTPERLAVALRQAWKRVARASLPSVRKDGRDLLRGIRTLRRDLRRMTRVTGTFVR